MPSLIDIRRRIRSVKNTQQITRALKMISVAKLRRAQERVVAARPYAQSLRELLGNLAAAAATDDRLAESPLLEHREEKRVQLILITSDTGRAGAFNANLTRATDRFFLEHGGSQSGSSFEVVAVGKKGRDYYRRRLGDLRGEYLGVLNKPAYGTASEIARDTIRRFREREIDAVYLMYNEFKSILSQKVNMVRVLPVDLPQGQQTLDYIYEQPPIHMLERLLPRYVETMIFQGMLETSAGEHAARMTAMDAATTNAGKVINTLTLTMNRARQAAITTEIIEVVSGAAAQD
jgi:F-type H+-transporting ATPase subunit gamma